MSFNKKTWKNRESQYPARRKLIRPDTGTETVYDIEREEGTVTEQGDDFSAENMNDLENRIEEALSSQILLTLLNPVGTVIYSTTCDTMAKVIEAYGGTTWIQHEGYVLRGATSNVTDDDNSNSGTGFGGSDTVTLTGAQSGLKGHGHGFTQPTVNGGATNTGYISADHAHRTSNTDNSRASSTTLYQASASYANGTWGYLRNESLYNTWTGGVSVNHYHPQAEHTHSVAGGAVWDVAASDATSSHSVVQRYKNVYIWERTA